MKGKSGNLFWFYPTPVEDYESEDKSKDAIRAKQIEDNTTKGFVRLLEICDDRLTQQVLDEVWGVPITSDVEDFSYDDQVQLTEIETEGQTMVFIGLADVRSDAERLIGSKSDDNPDFGKERVDAVITIEEGITVVIEIKTAGAPLQSGQMTKYAQYLGVDSSDQLRQSTWGDIHSLFDTILEKEPDWAKSLESGLIQEFFEYLKIEHLTKRVGVSEFGGGPAVENGGYNEIYIRMNKSPKYPTPRADEEPNFTIRFTADQHGKATKDIDFTESELHDLLNQIKEKAERHNINFISRAFVDGDWTAVEGMYREMNPNGNDAELAVVGDENGPKKIARIRKEDEKLKFQIQRWKGLNDWSQKMSYFTINEVGDPEFTQLFGENDGKFGIQKDIRHRFFVNREFLAFLDA